MGNFHTYVITHVPTRTFYVGSTANLEERLRQHVRMIFNGNHKNLNIRNLWKVGDELEILSISASSLQLAQKLEVDMIAEFKYIPRLLNIGQQAVGGDNLSQHPERDQILVRKSVASRAAFERMGAEQRLAIWSRPGERNPMFGKTHSDEVRKFLSENSKGRQTWLGRKHKASSLELLSQIASLRTAEKNHMYGKKHTAESRLRMSKSHQGQKPSRVVPVIVDGVLYPSFQSASRALGIALTVIRRRALNKNKKFDNYALAA